jgi:leader peptidase (prepilin peptidase)/N-methyltransferase
MDIVRVVAGALAGFGGGWWAARHQWLLYREPARSLAAANPLAATRVAAVAVLAAAAVALSLRPGHYEPGPAALAAGFALGLLVLASTDFERRTIPNRLTYPLIVLALGCSWAWPDRSVTDILIGVGAGAAIALTMAVAGLAATGGRAGATPIGMGDLKLVVLLGALLGWPLMVTGLIVGVVLGGFAAAATLLLRGRGAAFAYGPYLVAGGLYALLWP